METSCKCVDKIMLTPCGPRKAHSYDCLLRLETSHQARALYGVIDAWAYTDSPPETTKPSIRDSGARTTFPSGMLREPDTDRMLWSLLLDGPMLARWATQLTKGAKKYKPRNWVLGTASSDLEERETLKSRYQEAAFRHFMAWVTGMTDEDHAAALFFNVNGYEAMRETDG